MPRPDPVHADTTPARFIVAEVSCNWRAGELQSTKRPLCTLFEQAIAVNERRGYRLHSFQLHRLLTGPDEMNETIIAVFEHAVS